MSKPRKQYEEDLLNLITSLSCPECGLNYTEFAMLWSQAYVLGRLDILEEMGLAERRDCLKLMCELCHTIGELNLLSREVDIVS